MTAAPDPQPADVPDFFGTPDEIVRLEQRLAEAGGDIAERLADTVALGWYQRQRDTRAALRAVDAAVALQAGDPMLAGRHAGRLALIRAEAAWLLDRLPEAHAALAEARAACAATHDRIGEGDSGLVQASLLDHVGGDSLGALRGAQACYDGCGDPLRERLPVTWMTCIEATTDADGAAAQRSAALDDAAALGRDGLITFVEGAKGTLAWQRGDPGAAIVHFQRGCDAALACGQLQSAVTLAQNIGIAFSTLNDHEGALAWADRARAIVQPTGWPAITGWCAMQTGSMLLGLGRAREARDLLQQAMPALASTAGSRNHTLACQVLGEAALELGLDAEALHWCEAALRGAERLDYPDLVSGTLRHLARALSRAGQVEAALQAAQRGRTIAQAHHDWRCIATIEHVLAEVARAHRLAPPPGSHAASGTIHHLDAALAAGALMPGYVVPAEWHAELSAAHEAVGDAPRALAHERQASLARQQAQARRAEDMATALLVRHRLAQAVAEAQHQRTLAEASALRAELLQTQAALEKERLQSLLVHAGKMVAIGRLASGVVHEMSHPVGTLMLLSESLVERLSGQAPDEVGATLRTLVAETRRLQQFIGRLRDFARVEPPRIGTHDLRTVLADARQLFGPRLALERVSCTEELPALAVHVDPQRLALAVANVVFNAADALAGRAERQIRIAVASSDTGDMGDMGDTGAGDVLLHVDDNGPGLPEPVLARLFEPFFTTKPEGKGLGLGLALSAESLATMGGRIAARNRHDGGARFTITLRRA